MNEQVEIVGNKTGKQYDVFRQLLDGRWLVCGYMYGALEPALNDLEKFKKNSPSVSFTIFERDVSEWRTSEYSR